MAGIEIKATVEVQDNTARIRGEVEAGTEATTAEVAPLMQAIAVGLAPKRSGFMASKIRGKASGHTATLSLGGVRYGPAQEKGAAPHEIGGPGQFLTDRGDFAAVGPVLHPGNVGRHFLLHAWRAAAGKFPSIWKRNLP